MEAEGCAQVMFIKDGFALSTSIKVLVAPLLDVCHAVKMFTDKKNIHVKTKAAVKVIVFFFR